MDLRARVSEPPARCRVCLQSPQRADLSRRDLTSFYTVCGTTTTHSDHGEESWVCHYCWVRTSQCMKLIECARESERILGETCTETYYSQGIILYEYSTIVLGQTNICNYDSCQNSKMATKNHDYIKTEHRDCEESMSESALQEHFKVIYKKEVIDNKEVIDKKQGVEIDWLPETDLGPLQAPCGLKMETDAEYNDTYLLIIEPKEQRNVLETIIETECSNTDLPISHYRPKEQEDKVNQSQTNHKNVKKKINTTNSEVTSKRKFVRINEKYRRTGFETVLYSKDDQLEEIVTMKKSPKYLDCKYKCELCGKAYKNVNAFENHNSKWHKESAGAYECDVCHYRLPTHERIRRHVTAHGIRWRCARCRVVLRTPAACDAHRGRCDRERSQIGFDCALCSRICTSESSLKRHVTRTHALRERFACARCSRTYKQRASLKQHVAIAHATVVKLIRCDECGKQSASVDIHRKHLKTHAPRRQSEDLYCVECDRYFRSRVTLESHLRSTLKHVSRDTFRHVCGECTERFSERNQLELHVRTVHRKLRTHPCTLCDKAYFTSGALRSHSKVRHGAAERARDHVCSICGKAFLKQQTLKQHLQAVHWKQRPYACGVCAATFGFRAALYTHNKLKHASAHA